MADLATKEKPSALENGSDESDHGDKASTVFQNTDDTDLADPDEGKTPEERAKIVSSAAAQQECTIDGVQDKALVWKVDRWIIPWLSLLYLLSFLDR